MKRLILLITFLFLSTTALAQQAGRPRYVPTKPPDANSFPSRPCNPRDFIQAWDTDIESVCSKTGIWKDNVTAPGGVAGDVSGPASSVDN